MCFFSHKEMADDGSRGWKGGKGTWLWPCWHGTHTCHHHQARESLRHSVFVHSIPSVGSSSIQLIIIFTRRSKCIKNANGNTLPLWWPRHRPPVALLPVLSRCCFINLLN